MNVSIHPDLQQFIDDQVRAGRYATPEEVIHSALAHLASQSVSAADELEELKREIEVGVEQADRGEFVEFSAEDVIREGRELLNRKQKAV